MSSYVYVTQERIGYGVSISTFQNPIGFIKTYSSSDVSVIRVKWHLYLDIWGTWPARCTTSEKDGGDHPCSECLDPKVVSIHISLAETSYDPNLDFLASSNSLV